MNLIKSLKVPVIQAPMAGGINTPHFVASVIKAGGIGSFGFAYSSPDKIAEDLKKAKSLANGPINANFFIFDEIHPISDVDTRMAFNILQQLPGGDKLNEKNIQKPYFHNLHDQLESIWWMKPAMITFHFGIPSQEVIQRAKFLNIKIGVTATSINEAIAIEQSGADFVIAQGIEAGGHRGSFACTMNSSQDLKEQHKLLELISVINANVKIPIVAAGGIMNPNDVRSVLRNTSAVAVQMGTAFLTTKESNATSAHKRCLLEMKSRGTIYTSIFSGRPAQAIQNEFIRKMDGSTILPFPLQNTLTSAIRQAAVLRDDAEYQSLYAGSRYDQCRDISVADLMKEIEIELT